MLHELPALAELQEEPSTLELLSSEAPGSALLDALCVALPPVATDSADGGRWSPVPSQTLEPSLSPEPFIAFAAALARPGAPPAPGRPARPALLRPGGVLAALAIPPLVAAAAAATHGGPCADPRQPWAGAQGGALDHARREHVCAGTGSGLPNPAALDLAVRLAARVLAPLPPAAPGPPRAMGIGNGLVPGAPGGDAGALLALAWALAALAQARDATACPPLPRGSADGNLAELAGQGDPGLGAALPSSEALDLAQDELLPACLAALAVGALDLEHPDHRAAVSALAACASALSWRGRLLLLPALAAGAPGTLDPHNKLDGVVGALLLHAGGDTDAAGAVADALAFAACGAAHGRVLAGACARTGARPGARAGGGKAAHSRVGLAGVREEVAEALAGRLARALPCAPAGAALEAAARVLPNLTEAGFARCAHLHAQAWLCLAMLVARGQKLLPFAASPRIALIV